MANKVNRAQTLRLVLDLAFRNLIHRETLEPPKEQKPDWSKSWFKDEPRQPSQRAIQRQEEARVKFERMGLLPRSKD